MKTFDTVFSGSEGSEKVGEEGAAAAGGDGAAATEDGAGGSVFTGQVGRRAGPSGAQEARRRRSRTPQRRRPNVARWVLQVGRAWEEPWRPVRSPVHFGLVVNDVNINGMADCWASKHPMQVVLSLTGWPNSTRRRRYTCGNSWRPETSLWLGPLVSSTCIDVRCQLISTDIRYW